MFTNIRRIIALLVMLSLGSCQGSCTWMQPEITRRNVNSLQESKSTPLAIAVVTVRQRDIPVGSTRIELSRPVATQANNNVWSAITDENGHARIEVASDNNVSGSYLIRATANGSQIGSWSSISIKEGYEVMFDLPIGEEAQITGSSLLLDQGKTD